MSGSVLLRPNIVKPSLHSEKRRDGDVYSFDIADKAQRIEFVGDFAIAVAADYRIPPIDRILLSTAPNSKGSLTSVRGLNTA